MPKLGANMTEGSLVSWLVAEGDQVEEDQAIAEFETDKTVNELTSLTEGVLASIVVEAGEEEIPVGTTLAWILQEGESIDDIPGESARPLPAGEAEPTAAPVEAVDSAPEGRVEPFSKMRRAIARTVTESAAIPQATLFGRADAGAMRAARQKDRTVAFDDAIIYCVSRTLKNHPYLNAAFTEEGIRLYGQINVALAIAVDEGLVIPVIRGADAMSLAQIGDARQRLVAAVRSHQISEEDVAGGTFTVTNLGMYPVDRFAAMLNPPQTAILSVGRIQTLPAVDDDGTVVVRSFVEFGITVDHRAVDGAAAAAFLKDLIEQIESVGP